MVHANAFEDHFSKLFDINFNLIDYLIILSVFLYS